MTALDPTVSLIRVAAHSPAGAVAGAIAGQFRQHHHATVQAIGAAAVNQAVKALIIASEYLIEDALVLTCAPEFVEVVINGEEKTAIRFNVDGEPVRMLADPNMSPETAEALRELVRAARKQAEEQNIRMGKPFLIDPNESPDAE